MSSAAALILLANIVQAETPVLNPETHHAYFGGPVLGSVKLISVMWGHNVPANVRIRVPKFSAAIVNSTYMDPLVEYGTAQNAQDGREGTQQQIGRGSYLGQYVIDPFNSASVITEEDLIAELTQQIASGKLPASDANTLYMTYLPRDVALETGSGARTCIEFSAFHGAWPTTLADKNIYYTVQPVCDDSFYKIASGNAIDAITEEASHEFVEAVTDPFPTPGVNPGFPQAWNTAGGYELADVCVGATGLLMAEHKRYLVAQYWLNSRAACSTGDYLAGRPRGKVDPARRHRPKRRGFDAQ